MPEPKKNSVAFSATARLSRSIRIQHMKQRSAHTQGQWKAGFGKSACIDSLAEAGTQSVSFSMYQDMSNA